MITTSNQIGKPASRVEGRAKVTGVAKYAGEFNVPNLAHGVVVTRLDRQGSHQAHQCRGGARGRGRARRVDARQSRKARVIRR